MPLQPNGNCLPPPQKETLPLTGRQLVAAQAVPACVVNVFAPRLVLWLGQVVSHAGLLTDSSALTPMLPAQHNCQSP